MTPLDFVLFSSSIFSLITIFAFFYVLFFYLHLPKIVNVLKFRNKKLKKISIQKKEIPFFF